MGLPEPHYHSAIKTFTITPAPAPDKTSQAVLDAPPKSHAEPKAEHEVLTKIEPLAREARAEAPNLKHVGVEASAKRRGAISKSARYAAHQLPNRPLCSTDFLSRVISAIARPCGLLLLAIDQWPGYCRCKSGPQHGWTK